MAKDLVRARTVAKATGKHGKPPKGWWRWNIRNPYVYTRRMARDSENWYGRFLSPSRLQAAIQEDSYQSISLSDVRAIMRKAGVKNYYGKGRSL